MNLKSVYTPGTPDFPVLREITPFAKSAKEAYVTSVLSGSLDQKRDTLIPLIKMLFSDSTLLKKVESMNPSQIERLLSNKDALVSNLLSLVPTELRGKYENLKTLAPSLVSGSALAVLAANVREEGPLDPNDPMSGHLPPVPAALNEKSGGTVLTIAQNYAIRSGLGTIFSAMVTPEALMIGGAASLYLMSDNSTGRVMAKAILFQSKEETAHINDVAAGAFKASKPFLQVLNLGMPLSLFAGLCHYTAWKESRCDSSAVNQSVQEAVTIRYTDKLGRTAYKKQSRRSVIADEIKLALNSNDQKRARELARRLESVHFLRATGSDPKNMFPLGFPGSKTIPVSVTSVTVAEDHFLAVDHKIQAQKLMLHSTAIGLFQLVGSNIAEISQRMKLPIKPYAAYINDPDLLVPIEAHMFTTVMRAISAVGIRFDGESKGWIATGHGFKPSAIITARLTSPIGDLHYAPYAGVLMLLQMAWTNGTKCLTDSAAIIHYPERIWDLRGIVVLDDALNSSYSSAAAKKKYSQYIKT